MSKNRFTHKLLAVLFCSTLILTSACTSANSADTLDTVYTAVTENSAAVSQPASEAAAEGVASPGNGSMSSIPEYNGEAYVTVNNNVPYFTDSDLITSTQVNQNGTRTVYSYQTYSDLDRLGRCGPAIACIGQDIMPTKKRGPIGMIKPSGWHTVKYAGIDGNYLYNRCHLIGYQLTGMDSESADIDELSKDLITGTRYLNIEGMLDFENKTAEYIKSTGNHALYRVTPVFEGNNLLASGVLMEAESVEDKGPGLKFCAYCFNVQPGVTINYEDGSSSGPEYTGSSSADHSRSSWTKKEQQRTKERVEAASSVDVSNAAYIGNANSMKFHKPNCSSIEKMSDANKVTFSSREEAVKAGYKPCGICNP